MILYHMISVIATHEARLRCFLNSYLNNNVHRFQSGAVLKMTLSDIGTEIELVYDGEPTDGKPKDIYYVSTGSTLSANTREFPKISVKGGKYPHTYVFYLILHGQMHGTNINDAYLTSEGMKQAVRSGQGIPKPLKLDYIFASDLRRTRHMMINFFRGLGIQPTASIVVLPCAHDLKYVKGKPCDGNQGLSASANKMTCKRYTGKYVKNNTCKEQELGTYWNYYTGFYNGTRSKPGQGKKRCRNTDFVSQAIRYIKLRELKPLNPKFVPKEGYYTDELLEMCQDADLLASEINSCYRGSDADKYSILVASKISRLRQAENIKNAKSWEWYGIK